MRTAGGTAVLVLRWPSLLERHFRTELTAARGNRDTTILGCGVDFAEIGGPEGLARNAKARMVKHVDPVRAQLQVNAFSEAKALSQGEIKDRQAWPPQYVPTLIAEREFPTGRRIGESCGIKPLVGTWIGDVDVAHNVGKPVAAVVDVAAGCGAADATARNCRVLVLIVDYREWISALSDNRSRYPPSANRSVRQRVSIAHIHLSLAERQLVRYVSLER